jgi:hypothetical protein
METQFIINLSLPLIINMSMIISLILIHHHHQNHILISTITYLKTYSQHHQDMPQTMYQACAKLCLKHVSCHPKPCTKYITQECAITHINHIPRMCQNMFQACTISYLKPSSKYMPQECTKTSTTNLKYANL